MDGIEQKPLTVGQLRGLCKSKPSPQSISYWCRHGVKTEAGIVKLKRTKEGGRYVYFESDLREFLSKLNEAK